MTKELEPQKYTKEHERAPNLKIRNPKFGIRNRMALFPAHLL
jgi:hypothetical protein